MEPQVGVSRAASSRGWRSAISQPHVREPLVREPRLDERQLAPAWRPPQRSRQPGGLPRKAVANHKPHVSQVQHRFRQVSCVWKISHE